MKKGDIELQCAIVNAIDGKAEEMDFKLRYLSFDEFDTLSFYSHANDTQNQRKKQ